MTVVTVIAIGLGCVGFWLHGIAPFRFRNVVVGMALMCISAALLLGHFL